MKQITGIATTKNSKLLYQRLSDALLNQKLFSFDENSIDDFVKTVCSNFERHFLELSIDEESNKAHIDITVAYFDPDDYKNKIKSFVHKTKHKIDTSTDNIIDLVQDINSCFDFVDPMTSIESIIEGWTKMGIHEVNFKRIDNQTFDMDYDSYPNDWYLVKRESIGKINEVKQIILDIASEYPYDTTNQYGIFKTKSFQKMIASGLIQDVDFTKIMHVVSPINDNAMPLLFSNKIIDFVSRPGSVGIIDKYHELYNFIDKHEFILINNLQALVNNFIVDEDMFNDEQQDNTFSLFSKLLFSCKVPKNRDVPKYRHIYDDHVSHIYVSVFGKSKYYVEVKIKPKDKSKDKSNEKHTEKGK